MRRMCPAMHLRWTARAAARHIACVLFLLALLSGWLTGAPSWAGVVQEIRVHSDRIDVTFDASVAETGPFILAGPQRIALELGGKAPGRSGAGAGATAAVREGVRDGAHVVLDLARPAISTDGGF